MEALAPTLVLELVLARVNAITSGLMDTPLLHITYDAERDTIVQNRAVIVSGKRVGTVDEVVQVILMLMTNAYVSGEVEHVDGVAALCHNARSIRWTIDD